MFSLALQTEILTGRTFSHKGRRAQPYLWYMFVNFICIKDKNQCLSIYMYVSCKRTAAVSFTS